MFQEDQPATACSFTYRYSPCQSIVPEGLQLQLCWGGLPALSLGFFPFLKDRALNCLCREVVIAEDALIIVIAIVLYKVARRYRVAGFLFEPNSTVTVDNQISS